MRLKAWFWMFLSPVALIIGLGMGADTGQWWLAILGGVGTILLVLRVIGVWNE